MESPDNQTADLVPNRFAKWEDKADVMVPSATNQIYEFIHEKYARPTTDTNVNRASAATMCAKRRWFQHRGHEGTPLTPRKLVNFLLGDLVEMVAVYFITEACVGPGKLYSEVNFGDMRNEVKIGDKVMKTFNQQTLHTKIDDLDITCHADGFGKRNSDGEWELIECKSAANWGFKDFQNNGPHDYVKQAHAVMASEECRMLGIKTTRYFYFRKETGHLWDRVISWMPATWEIVRKEYLDVMNDNPMPTPFQLVPEMAGRSPNKKPTGRYTAQFPCTYCPYLAKCQGNFTLEWATEQWGNMSPKYIFEKKVF